MRTSLPIIPVRPVEGQKRPCDREMGARTAGIIPSVLRPYWSIHPRVAPTAFIDHSVHRCLISMGAIVLNGASIGTESIIAAGTIVVEGPTVPPRSLVMGRPGRVRRAVTTDEVVAIQRDAAHYVKYKTEFSELSS